MEQLSDCISRNGAMYGTGWEAFVGVCMDRFVYGLQRKHIYEVKEHNNTRLAYADRIVIVSARSRRAGR